VIGGFSDQLNFGLKRYERSEFLG